MLLGVGLGGFIDGILLHQILQWHHMATSAGESASTVGGLETNTLLDGFFHLATWFFVIGGSTLAVSEWRHIGFLVLGLVLATSGSLLARGGPEANFESRRSP